MVWLWTWWVTHSTQCWSGAWVLRASLSPLGYLSCYKLTVFLPLEAIWENMKWNSVIEKQVQIFDTKTELLCTDRRSTHNECFGFLGNGKLCSLKRRKWHFSVGEASPKTADRKLCSEPFFSIDIICMCSLVSAYKAVDAVQHSALKFYCWTICKTNMSHGFIYEKKVWYW